MERTSPEVPLSDRYKDAHAHEALQLASRLFDFLAGWARDHLVGRALNSIPSAPYAPGTQREQELGDDRPWDDVDIEPQGAAYDYSDPEINQRIVAEFTYAASRVFGWRLASELSEAFRALSFGETTDLVRPRKSHLKGRAYTLWQLRLKAVQLTAFRHGTGMTKHEAQTVVATAFDLGRPPDVDGWKTVERWQTRLPERLDPHMVQDAIRTSYVGGEWYVELSKRSGLDDSDRDFLQYLENQFGDEALKEAGCEFRRLQPRGRSQR